MWVKREDFILRTRITLLNRSGTSGVTLIELMLAMVVAGALVLYLSVHMKNQTQDRQLQKTSIEMQSILTAAASYYLNSQDVFYSAVATQSSATGSAGSNIISSYQGQTNDTSKIQSNFWPANITTLYQTNGSQSENFLDAWSQCASWPYTSGTACNNNATLAGYDTAILGNGTYFGVNITMPTAQLAIKLLAKLPAGEIDASNSQKVWTYIPRPTGHYNPSLLSQKCEGPVADNTRCSSGEIMGAHGWVTSAGVVNSYPGDPLNQSNPTKGTLGRTIVLPECPSGYEGHYITSYGTVQTGNCVAYSDYVWGGFVVDSPMFWHMQIYETGYNGGSSPTGSLTNSIGGYRTYFPSISVKFSPFSSSCNDWTYPLNLSGWYQRWAVTQDTGYMVEYFVTFCVPNKHWIINITTNSEQFCNQSGFLSSNHAGYVLQCQNSWPTYNPGTNTGQCPVASSSVC